MGRDVDFSEGCEMTSLRFALMLLLCASISGCELLCQAGTGTCGMSSEEAHELLHPKPYGAHWIKLGMTEKSRLDDAQACGGDRDLQLNGFSRKEIESAKHRGDPNDILAIWRLRQRWAECMKSKGYHYEE